MSTLIAGWATFIVVSATPGPSTLAIASLAMAHGRASAMAFAAGVVVASQIWGWLAVAGFASVMEAYAGIVVALKLACAGYLLYLAAKAWRRSAADMPAAAVGAGEARPFRSALALHLSNPKAILGWLAVVVIGVPSGDPALAAPFLAGCAVLAAIVNGGYALAFSSAPVRLAYGRGRRSIERGVAMLFGAAAVGLAASVVRR